MLDDIPWKRRPLPIGAIIIVFGCLIGLAALVGLYSDLSFFVSSISTNGRVISCQQIYHSNDCYATVSFETQTHQQVTFSFQTNSWHKGDTVPVRYRPDDPGNARISGLSAGDYVVLILVLIALTLCGIGIRRKLKEHAREKKERLKKAQRLEKRMRKVQLLAKKEALQRERRRTSDLQRQSSKETR